MSVTGYSAGAFDLFHIGRLRHLKAARRHCDRLIAGLTTDELSPTYNRKDALGPSAHRLGERHQGDVMHETCDRCGPIVRAAYRAARSGQLYLCGHCAAQLTPALRAKGWTICPMADDSPGQRTAA
jgi:hypothetical protein